MDALSVHPRGKEVFYYGRKTYKLFVVSNKNSKIVEEQVFFEIDVLQAAVKYLDISIDNGAALEYEIYMLDYTGAWIVI